MAQLRKLAAEATCGAILSSEDILIGCDLANRSCSPETDNLRLGILGQTSIQKGLRIKATLHGVKYMPCAILRAKFTWLALKIPWLTANMAPEIRGVTELRLLP
jgi:hypothetical protein